MGQVRCFIIPPPSPTMRFGAKFDKTIPTKNFKNVEPNA